ncbi:MAG: acyltransferase [Acidobacteria bacterium]|nr:acyltransferase [Acidobacteriota bacterium]
MHFTPPKHHRFLLLDALRGIAALFVVAVHLPTALSLPFTAEGQLAVDFFFCLSGFVIAFSYEKRLSESVSFKDFAIARFIRLYPIYAIGSLIGLIFSILTFRFAFHSDWLQMPWLSWTYLLTLAIFLWPTRLSSAEPSFNYPLNVPAWSIFYEIAANLAYASLVRLRIARNWVLLSIVSVSFALLFANVVAAGRPLDFGPRQAGFGLGFARVAFSFFLGVLIYRAHRRTRSSEEKRTRWFPSVMITAALLVILSAPFSLMHTGGFHLFEASVCFPAIVYYGAAARVPHSFARVSTVLGELSYPLYLLHFPFILLMNARRFLSFAGAHAALFHWIGFVLISIFAFVAWQVGEHIELPIRRVLTRQYNSYKQGLAQSSPKASKQNTHSAT